jgi:Domain of unknown function (DUF1835)/Protein of unknown function
MIHIVFNEPDVDVLNKAIALDDGLQGEVVLVRDDYAVGPLNDIFLPDGVEARKDWWRMVLRGTEAELAVDEGKVNDPFVVNGLIQSLVNNPAEVLWIWAAQNKHDVCGYYWLMSQLPEFQGRVFILYLNNLPFINEKGGIFYPEWLSQIQPREFIKAKKLARPITPSEFEVDADEWMKTCASGSMVRLLEGGKKLLGESVDRYDTDLASLITAEFQKASKIIHAFLTRKNKETTGDTFMLWRLKTLVHQGGYDVLGELKGAKDFEVKLKTAAETPA